MKRMNILHWIMASVFLSMFAACTDEDIVQKTQYDVVEGVPVRIVLNFNVEKSRISTRSASSATLENTVNSLYIIAFHGQDVWARDFRDNVNGIKNGTIDQLDIKSGTEIQLYAIANVNSGVGTLNKTALDGITTYDGFLNLTTKLVNPLNTERMGFLMLGQLKANDGTSNIAIDETGKILSGITNIELQRLDARISFFVKADNSKHPDMKFEPKYYTVEQIPQASYLVPHDVDYDNGFASMEAAQARNYFDTDSEFEGTDDDYNEYDFFEFYLLENRKKAEVLIIEGDDTKYKTESLYALREKRKESATENPDGSKPGQEYVAGDFLFAPKNSAYVKIYGTLTYTAEEEGIQKFYNANVCYTVHLGSTGSDANNVDLVNNYDTERNVWYRYYVTITGLNSLKVEVKEDREERPGAEGDVIVGGGEVKDIDAHYGRQKFSLTREAVLSGLSWAVSTPFQSGLKAFNRDYFLDGVGGDVITDETRLADVDGLRTDLTLNDYKWVQFAINAECVDPTSASHVYVKYPGYSAYSGGSGNDNSAPAFGGGGKYSSFYKKTVKLYDVNQLLNHLYVEANKTNSQIFLDDKGKASSENDATVTITAYIDEYIYKYKPTEVFYEEPDAVQDDDPDLLLWKDVVNGENRMLHICEAGAEYSRDGNSSWAESVITFSQRPVYTFYDPTSDVKTAWGTESLMETDDVLSIGEYGRTSDNYSYPNTPDNGRKNQLNFLKKGDEIGKLAWTAVLSLDEDEYGKLQSGYNSIWYACIGRNRDLNGNNVIDENEIRWYLASVDQLTDLWIGEEAVPNAKLFPLDPQGTELVPYVHVASSTYFSSSSDSPWVIWAEEGASRGQYREGGDNKNADGTIQTTEEEFKRYYRCVRNLGLSLNHISDTPADYVVPTENKTRTVGTGWNQKTYTEHWIDVTRLERNTRRSILVGQPLPNNDVTERSRNNRPYDKFAVLVKEDGAKAIYPETPRFSWQGVDISENGKWTDYYTSESNGTPCPSGYRIPNQRELMLIYTTFPDLFSDGSESWMYMAKTGFGWKNHTGYGDNRAGFAYDRGNLRLIDNASQAVKVRCVRDVEPGE